VISTATNTRGGTIPVGAFPVGVAFTPNGAFAYVVNQNSNDVSVITTATRTVAATVAVGTTPWGGGCHAERRVGYVTTRHKRRIGDQHRTNAVVATFRWEQSSWVGY